MTVRIIVGDVRDKLRELADASVHCCVTSPPYFGLRDYGTGQWQGGDTGCDHSRFLGGNGLASAKQVSSGGTQKYQYISDCGKCGATRIDSQIGLEATPDAYVAELVAVFREVRRVLRNDGTVWLNLGDSYASGGTGGTSDKSKLHGGLGVGPTEKIKQGPIISRKPSECLKPKDLIGIPWRVAFALQADGWYLRQDIIWSKPNPMPESVTDRCTKAHEYMFLLSKSARYYFDAEAIAEVSAYPGDNRAERTDTRKLIDPFCQDNGSRARTGSPTGDTRNKRSVWEVASQPFSEAHFATFPPALIEPCIKAGCPAGGMVLDPFGGAGTTGLVADRLGRNAVLIELNPEYAALAERRIHADAGLFASLEMVI